MAFNAKIFNLAQGVVDHLTQFISNSAGRLPPWNVPVPGYPLTNNAVLVKYDTNNDLYIEVNVDGGATPDAIIKYKTYPVPGNELVNPVTGLSQTMFSPHIVQVGFDIGANASGTATLLNAVATNAVTINGVAFTAVASGATGNQWNIGASDAASAVNLATAINGSVTAGAAGVVFAVASGTVVTIYSSVPGTYANNITLTKTGVPITVSGATLAGGTGASLPASDWLFALIMGEVSDQAVEVQLYEKSGIANTDLGTSTYLVGTFRSVEWGALDRI